MRPLKITILFLGNIILNTDSSALAAKADAYLLDTTAPIDHVSGCISTPSKSSIGKLFDLGASYSSFFKKTGKVHPAIDPQITDRRCLAIDEIVAAMVRNKQSQLIRIVCESPQKQTKQIPTRDFRSLFENPSEANTDCLSKMSQLWLEPEKLVEAVTDMEPSLSDSMRNHHLSLDESSVILSYLKNLRSQMALTYFQTRFLSTIEQKTGVTPDIINQCTVGFGFNRLFSPRNQLGASPASDVDFKVVIDEDCAKLHKVEEILSKSNVSEILKEAAQEFQKNFQITLEIDDFTVKTKKEVLEFTENRNEKELNFYSTTIYDHTYLFGNKKLEGNLFWTIKSSIRRENRASFQRSVNQRRFDQYIGDKTDKGSIGVIKNIRSIRGQEDKRLAKLARSFEGDYVGMPQMNIRYQKDKNWIFSTKYTLLRPYDFDPSNKVARSLNVIGINFQYLIVKYLHAQGVTADEIDKRYDKITWEDFRNLYLDPGFHNDIRKLIKKSCESDLVPLRTCHSMNRLAKKPKEDALKEVAFTYFDELFKKADRLTQKLDPAKKEKRFTSLPFFGSKQPQP